MRFLFITIIASILFLEQEKLMQGAYEMQFEEKYTSQNCIIKFTDNSYERVLKNGKKANGFVRTENRDVILKDSKTGLEMSFFKMHKNRDTIYFKTKKENDEPAPKNDVIIYAGKLIRIKN